MVIIQASGKGDMPKKALSLRLSEAVRNALQQDAEAQTKEYKKTSRKITRSDVARKILEDHYSLSDRPDRSEYPPKLMCPKYKGGKWLLLETLLMTCKKCSFKNSCPAWKIFGVTSIPQKERS